MINYTIDTLMSRLGCEKFPERWRSIYDDAKIMLENGEKCPTVETLDAICFAFGITLADFFTEKREESLVDRVSSLTENQKRLLNEFLNSL